VWEGISIGCPPPGLKNLNRLGHPDHRRNEGRGRRDAVDARESESESVLESASESESPRSGRKKSSGSGDSGSGGSWSEVSTLICVGGAMDGG